MRVHKFAASVCALAAALAGAVALGGATALAQEQGATYRCDSGASIVVHHQTAAADGTTLRLEYDGRTFELYQIASSPGRFATEMGLRPDHGLQWSSDSSRAQLSEMIMDHTAAEPTVIEACVLETTSADPGSVDADTTLPLGSWRLATLEAAEVDPSVEAFMTFNPDGSVNGNGGCNTFGGRAMATPTGISISDVFSTRMACEPDRNAVEIAFLSVLERAAAQRVEDGTLVLYGPDGENLAGFELTSSDPDAGVSPAGSPPAVNDGATLFRDVRIFDGKSEDLSGPSNVLVEGNVIAAISEDAIETGDAEVTIIEGDGRVLMPGLIDAHWHTMLIRNNPAQAINGDLGYNNIAAADEASDTLMRGFTTVRDVGGPSFGLKQAIDEGLVEGPRIYPSGAMITVTSGHGDFRQLFELPRTIGGHMARMELIGGSMVADSPDEVRLRVREQLMLGASQIKLTAGGGVSSPFSPVDVSTFTLEELRAAVEAAENWGTYVTAHAFTPQAIRRSIDAGVKVIEHGFLMDEATAQYIAERDIWLSLQPLPEALRLGFPEGSVQREGADKVFPGIDQTYQLAKRYNIKTAWGTDVLFSQALATQQGAILASLERWYTPAEALVMATGTNAELLALSGERNPYPGRLGVVEEGALADLLLVDGNPLEDLSLVADPANFLIIMKDGVVYKNAVPSGQ